MNRLLMALSVLALITSCGGDDSSSTSTSSGVTVSGTLGDSTSEDLQVSSFGKKKMISKQIALTEKQLFGTRDVDAAGKTVNCVMIEEPFTTYSATIGSDGAFSVSIPPNIDVTCRVMDGDDPTATFVISDSSNKSMNGGDKQIDKMAMETSIDLGDQEYDENSGKVEIAKTVLGSALKEAVVDDPFDFTGTYLAEDMGSSLPAGYLGLCPQGSQNCSGPVSGETFYVKRLAGKEYVNGAATTTDKFGIMVWKDQTSFTSCGSKLGVTYADAQTNAGIDLTNSGVNEGTFSWSTSATIDGTPYNITDGWKIAEARATHDSPNCEMTTVGVIPGWKCYDGVGKYSISLGGGCVDANNSPTQVNDWSGMTCEASTLTGTFAGYTRHVCRNGSGTTCTDISYQESGYNWGSVTNLLNNNALCSSAGVASDKAALAGLKCYAEFYWNTVSNSASSSLCLKDIRSDWSATTAATFLETSGPVKAKNQYILELFDYINNDAGTFRNEEIFSKGISMAGYGGSTTWVNCRVMESMTMTIMEKSATQLQAEFVMESRVLDTKQACRTTAALTALGANGATRHMFLMTRQ